MAITKVLLTGASGYIGGAVLAQILSSAYSDVTISALVRSSAHAEKIQRLGVKPILFDGLGDVGFMKSVASEYDIVISCASAMDLPSCLALVEGLGIRKAETNSEVHYIHTSGTSNFGDHPITSQAVLDIRTDKDEIFGWEKENQDGWITRKVDVAITEMGLRLGVKTYIVNPPLIYGTGAGPINQRSLQVPALIKMSLALKQAVVLGEGKGIWNIVHIRDVAAMYDLIVGTLLQKQSVSTGKEGYFFVESGETTWLSISEAIALAGNSQGLFASAELKSLSPESFAANLGISWLKGYMAEVIWGSNSRIRGIKSRELGWKPTVPVDGFANSIAKEVKVIQSQLQDQSVGEERHG